jgi:hypothetical protein
VLEAAVPEDVDAAVLLLVWLWPNVIASIRIAARNTNTARFISASVEDQCRIDYTQQRQGKRTIAAKKKYAVTDSR